MSVVRFLKRTARAVREKIHLAVLREEEGYCLRCSSCGVDGCCPAEHCDNGPLCAGYYGNRDQRNQLIGHRQGWDQCSEWNAKEIRRLKGIAEAAIDVVEHVAIADQQYPSARKYLRILKDKLENQGSK